MLFYDTAIQYLGARKRNPSSANSANLFLESQKNSTFRSRSRLRIRQ